MKYSPKLLGLGLIAGLVLLGLLGLVRAVQGFQWGQGLELITTIFTLLLCFNYFAFQKEGKVLWYRILMVWAAMLLLSYLASFFMPATQSYTIMEDIGLSRFTLPLIIWFGLTIPVFIKEFFKPGTKFELNKNPLRVLLGSIAIIFGFLSGLVPFMAMVSSAQVPLGGWGALGLCETAIFGLIIGFLVLLKLSKWLSVVTAICAGFMLITGVFPHITDLAVYLSLFVAALIFILKAIRQSLVARKRAVSK